MELFDAWAAPGSPYVDIYHFAFEGFYRIFQIFNCGVARQNVIVLVVDAAVLEAEVFINAGSRTDRKGLLGNSALYLSYSWGIEGVILV